MKKGILSFLLALSLIVTCVLPAASLADGSPLTALTEMATLAVEEAKAAEEAARIPGLAKIKKGVILYADDQLSEEIGALKVKATVVLTEKGEKAAAIQYAVEEKDEVVVKEAFVKVDEITLLSDDEIRVWDAGEHEKSAKYEQFVLEAVIFAEKKDAAREKTGTDTEIANATAALTISSVTVAMNPLAMGTAQTFTVKTQSTAKYLGMFKEDGTKVKAWAADGNSKVSGTTRIWTVKYTFTTAGDRTMTFKPGTSATAFSTNKKAVSFKVVNVTVSSATAAATALTNVEHVFTVKTPTAATYLMMYNGSKVLKSYSADMYSAVSGSTRIWTVGYPFTGAGSKKISFKGGVKAGVGGGTAKAVSFKVEGAGVISLTANKQVLLKTPMYFTVETNKDAKYLVMCKEDGGKVKTWAASGNSTVDGGIRTWKVSYTFSGKGTRTMTFKAGKTTSAWGSKKASATFTVASYQKGVLKAVAESNPLPKGQMQTFVVKTNTEAQYLMMYVENGSLFKTWTANNDSVIDGSERVWTVQLKFSSAGSRKVTFKAADKDDTPFKASKAVSFTVNSATMGVISAEVKYDTVEKGQAEVFVVKTSKDAAVLRMCKEDGKTKVADWAASANSEVVGTERIWTVTYAFSGAGNREMTFKAGKTASSLGAVTKKVKFTIANSDAGVLSATASGASGVAKYPISFTVRTNANAKYLMMYKEDGALVKAWPVSGNAKKDGTNGDLIWTVSYTFSGTGSRTMTFKAGKTKTNPYTAAKSVKFTLKSEGIISAVASAPSVKQSENVTFTIKTPTTAKYVMMYTENGKMFKSWSSGYKDSSNVRTWTIKMSFSGIGERQFTFKASKTGTSAPAGSTAVVPLSIIAGDFEVSSKKLIAYHGTDTAVVIPSDLGITTIGADAFRGTAVTSITIPSGVTTIEPYAFEYCTALTKVEFPATLKTMGAYAFSKCGKLTAVDLKSTKLTVIAEGAFNLCEKLAKASLPSTITTIGKRAFYYCTSLANMD